MVETIDDNEFITFRIENATYTVNVFKTREILSATEVILSLLLA